MLWITRNTFLDVDAFETKLIVFNKSISEENLNHFSS